MSDDCLGARFEILLDDKTEFCRDTMLTAMGAAHLLKHQRPNSNVAVRDLQTGQLTSDKHPSRQIHRPARWRSAHGRGRAFHPLPSMWWVD